MLHEIASEMDLHDKAVRPESHETVEVKPEELKRVGPKDKPSIGEESYD